MSLYETEEFACYYSTRDLSSVQSTISAQANKLLEYYPDKKAAARMPDIEPCLRLQILLFIYLQEDFEEDNSGDFKIVPVH